MASKAAFRIDKLLAFLPGFEAGTPAGERRGGERQPDGSFTFPYFAYSDFMVRFIDACYDGKWVRPGFDWPAWEAEALSYQENPILLKGAGIGILEQLLTAHLRLDHFAEGHLSEVVESGLITAILQRLREIRAEVP